MITDHALQVSRSFFIYLRPAFGVKTIDMINVTSEFVGAGGAAMVAIEPTCPVVVPLLSIQVWSPTTFTSSSSSGFGSVDGKGGNKLSLGGSELVHKVLDRCSKGNHGCTVDSNGGGKFGDSVGGIDL